MVQMPLFPQFKLRLDMRSSQLSLAVAVAFAGIALPTSGRCQPLRNANYGLVDGEVEFLNVNTPSFTLFDQFDYVITAPFDYLTPMLKSGFAYDVRISGRGGIGGRDGTNNATPDAAFDFYNWQDLDLVHIPTERYYWVATWDDVKGRRPSPDVYTTTHVYDYYIQGQDVGLAFRFRDDPYGDNSGGFNVSIFELGQISTVPEPTSITLMIAGLAGIMILVRLRLKRSPTRPASRVFLASGR